MSKTHGAHGGPAEGAKFLTVREVAAILRISPRTVYRLIAVGEIKAITIGKQHRVAVSSLPAEVAQ